MAMRTRLLNLVLRDWFHHLSAIERLIVIFVYDRTWGWNKEWEVITYEHFTKGVFGYIPAGKWTGELGEIRSYAAPVSSDRTTVSKALNSLVAKGALLRRKVKGHPRGLIQYSLNAGWDFPGDPELPDKFVLINKAVFTEEWEEVRKIEEKEERRKARNRERKRAARRRRRSPD